MKLQITWRVSLITWYTTEAYVLYGTDIHYSTKTAIKCAQEYHVAIENLALWQFCSRLCNHLIKLPKTFLPYDGDVAPYQLNCPYMYVDGNMNTSACVHVLIIHTYLVAGWVFLTGCDTKLHSLHSHFFIHVWMLNQLGIDKIITHWHWVRLSEIEKLAT